MEERKNEVLNLKDAWTGNPQDSPAPAKGEISWQTEEFAYHKKDPQWFIIAGIIALGIFVSLLILKNVFGAATILLFAIIIYMYAGKKPEVLEVDVYERGITINKKLIPWSAITSFWILYEPPLKDLILIHKARFIPKIIIPLGNADPLKLREIFLANSVTEKEEEESLTEILARRFGF